jgi:hypothetical protein
MTSEEFDTFVNNFTHDRTLVVADRKVRYEADDDRLSNFKEIANLTGMHPAQVAAVYWYKHIRSVMQMVRKTAEGKKWGAPPGEDVMAPLHDVANYTEFLAAILLLHISGGDHGNLD